MDVIASQGQMMGGFLLEFHVNTQLAILLIKSHSVGATGRPRGCQRVREGRFPGDDIFFLPLNVGVVGCRHLAPSVLAGVKKQAMVERSG